MMVMVDISGDRGSLVGLANSWLQVVAGAWMGMARERERCGMRELTHCAVASKQARVRVRAAAVARQTDPQVHALQHSTALHPHPLGNQHSECGYCSSSAYADTQRVRPPSPALPCLSAEYIASYATTTTTTTPDRPSTRLPLIHTLPGR